MGTGKLCKPFGKSYNNVMPQHEHLYINNLKIKSTFYLIKIIQHLKN